VRSGTPIRRSSCRSTRRCTILGVRVPPRQLARVAGPGGESIVARERARCRRSPRRSNRFADRGLLLAYTDEETYPEAESSTQGTNAGTVVVAPAGAGDARSSRAARRPVGGVVRLTVDESGSLGDDGASQTQQIEIPLAASGPDRTHRRRGFRTLSASTTIAGPPTTMGRMSGKHRTAMTRLRCSSRRRSSRCRGPRNGSIGARRPQRFVLNK